MSDTLKGTLSVMVPVLFWGISFVNTAYLLEFLGPMSIGGIRFIIATVILFSVMKATKQSMKIDKGDRPYFFASGLFGVAIYFFFENYGIKYISASPASLILSGIPIVMMVAEAIITHKKIDLIGLAGIVISVLGVALIVTKGTFVGFMGTQKLGLFMMVGAVVTWVVYSFVSDKLFEKYGYLTIIFYQFLYALPFFMPFLILEENNWNKLEFTGWAHLVFLGVLASVFGFYYYAKAMDLLGITISSVYINFIPVVTIVFSRFYLHETLEPIQMLGGLLIIFSVTATTVRGQKKKCLV